MASNYDIKNRDDIPAVRVSGKTTDQTERYEDIEMANFGPVEKRVTRTYEETEMTNFEVIAAKTSNDKVECHHICDRILSSVSTVLILAFLIWFVVGYGKDLSLPPQDGYSKITKGGVCSLKIMESDIVNFERMVVDTNVEAMYVNLRSVQNVTTTTNTDIFLPQEWIWTYDDSPILGWPESYDLFSFGILGLRTKRDVDMNLLINFTISGCSFTWGEYSSTLAVGNVLMNMTKGLFDKNNKLKQSRWCYRLKERDIEIYRVNEQIFSFFVQDVSFKCCTFKRNESGYMVIACNNSVEIDILWTVPPFIVSYIILLLSPILVVYLSRYLSFESHVHWITHTHQTSDFDITHPDTDGTWVFADYKSPVTFFSFLKSSMVRKQTVCTFIKNVLLALFKVAGSLSVIILCLLMHRLSPSNYKQVEQEIKSGIPVGFLSLLFPSYTNNFLYVIKGPYVFIGVYIASAVVYFCLLQWFMDSKYVYPKTYDTGNFTLNLDLVKKYGGMGSGFNSQYELLKTIQANFRAVFHLNFWCDLRKRLWFGDETVCWKRGRQCNCKYLGFNIVLKLIVLPMSCLFSICVHLIPFLFANCLILNDCLPGTKRHKGGCCTCMCHICITLLHIWVSASLIMIFIGSAEFIMFLFSFSVLSVVLYPGAASGIFIFAFSGAYYVVEKIRSIGRNYATYRDLLILISHDLCDKCKGAEAMCSNDRKKMVIAGVRTCDVANIEICFLKVEAGGQQTENKRNNLSFHCHLKEKTLKIFDVETSCLEKVSMNGLDFKLDVPKDQSKLMLVVKSDGSDRRLVQMNTSNTDERVSDTMNPDEDVCYVMYRHGLKGIPRDLLDEVIQKHMPVSVERCFAFVWTVLLILILVWIHFIIRRFKEWEQMTTIVQALISLVIVHLLKVIREFSLDVNELERKNILKGKLRLTILEYWENEYKKSYKSSTKVQSATSTEDQSASSTEDQSASSTEDQSASSTDHEFQSVTSTEVQPATLTKVQPATSTAVQSAISTEVQSATSTEDTRVG